MNPPPITQPNVIQVSGNTLREVLAVLATNLQVKVDEGWRLGNAYALVDGWKNVYEMQRGNEMTKIEFDLRQALPALGNTMMFVTLSMTLVQGNSPVASLAKADNFLNALNGSRPRSGLHAKHIVLALVILGIVILMALSSN